MTTTVTPAPRPAPPAEPTPGEYRGRHRVTSETRHWHLAPAIVGRYRKDATR